MKTWRDEKTRIEDKIKTRIEMVKAAFKKYLASSIKHHYMLLYGATDGGVSLTGEYTRYTCAVAEDGSWTPSGI